MRKLDSFFAMSLLCAHGLAAEPTVAIPASENVPEKQSAPALIFAQATALRQEAESLGKPSWRTMLKYVADLHVTSTHAAEPPFEFPWEEIGPGYRAIGLGPAFGHWDIVHQILDVLPASPEHARQQLLNDIRLQLKEV